jgi:hypothetical protein
LSALSGEKGFLLASIPWEVCCGISLRSVTGPDERNNHG